MIPRIHSGTWPLLKQASFWGQSVLSTKEVSVLAPKLHWASSRTFK